MTVAAQTSNVVYTGNGATTNWAFDFEIPTGADLVSLFDIPTGVLTPLSTSDYVISGLDDPDGGSVTYTPALPATKRIVIERDLEYTQDLDLTTQSAYNPEDLESQLDRIVMQIQQLKADSDRAVKVTLGSTLDPDAFIAALQQSAADAAESAGEAADSAILAQQWAENPEDDEVVPGGFSALHWAAKAAGFAGTIDLPAAPAALNYLRRNAGNTAYENRTVVQVAEDISALRYDAAQGLTLARQGQARANAGIFSLTGDCSPIINGNFSIWQRATSQTSSGYGAEDRWTNSHVGSTKTASRQAFTLGQTDVPGNPKYYARTVVVSAANAANYVLKGQRIEGVDTFAGKTVTVTFWAKADAAKNIAVELYQDFGTGGSPSTGVSTPCGLKALTTAWQKISFTAVIPSIAGKTLGSTANDSLGLYIWFESGATNAARASNIGQQSGTFDIARVSIVEGDATAEADPFPVRHIQREMQLCQRYLAMFGGESAFEAYGSGGFTAGTSGSIIIEMPQRLRANPTIEASNNMAVLNASGTNIALIALNMNQAGTLKQLCNFTIASGGAAGDTALLTANNNLASRLSFTAEL